MRIAVWHRNRLSREAVRRALTRSEFEIMWTLGESPAVEERLGHEPVELLLLETQLLQEHGDKLANLIKQTNVVLLHDSGAINLVYRALEQGALGNVPTPALNELGELQGADAFCERLIRLAKARRRPHAECLVAPRFFSTPLKAVPRTMPDGQNVASKPDLPLIAIGASTGGPHAIAQILSQLPSELAAAVLVVQHIEQDFTTGLVDWFSTRTKLKVEMARRGNSLQRGRVYVAAPGTHLVLQAHGVLTERSGQTSELHVPSVDALFQSLVHYPKPGTAVLLTGMGADGAHGLLALKKAGWHTIAQDQASSVVYGMPRAAVELGACDQVLALDQVASVLIRKLEREYLRGVV
jgi:two-component system, chemotaxis family, response regulator WspF